MHTYAGTVENVIFSGADSGFSVFILRLDGEEEQLTIAQYMSEEEGCLTCTGTLPNLHEGERLEVAGQFVNHPRYGWQLKITQARRMPPTGLASIEKYLASGIIKGIGERTAKRIVARFGADSFDVIANEPQRLAEMKGISIKMAYRFQEAFHAQAGRRDAILFLQEYGISPAMAMRIHKKYGEDTIELVRTQPFRLADDIDGIGFKRADAIARRMGCDPHSAERVGAGVRFLLWEAANDGHTFLPQDVLTARAQELLEVDAATVENEIIQMQMQRLIVREIVRGGKNARAAGIFLTVPPRPSARSPLGADAGIIGGSSPLTWVDDTPSASNPQSFAENSPALPAYQGATAPKGGAAQSEISPQPAHSSHPALPPASALVGEKTPTASAPRVFISAMYYAEKGVAQRLFLLAGEMSGVGGMGIAASGVDGAGVLPLHAGEASEFFANDCGLDAEGVSSTQVSEELHSVAPASVQGEYPRPAEAEAAKSHSPALDAAISAADGIALSAGQVRAIAAGVTRGVLVITGGPGTGKTTVINTLIGILERQGQKVILAAPTGRAAKRMTEATGREASTIHRLLEVSFVSEDTRRTVFERNEENPLECDVLIVDEASMLDVSLTHSLLKAVESGTRLILVGDVDQLPSVGAGSVLKDIIESGAVDVVRLTEVFRQAQESAIIMNAHRINRGEYPSLNDRERDFFFVKRASAEGVADTLLDLVTNRLPSYMPLDAKTDIQVLTPTRKTVLGVARLNTLLQARLNPPSPRKNERESGAHIFREGDKVMQIRNNYDIAWELLEGSRVIDRGAGIFNGDMGVIQRISDDDGVLTVLFDDNRRVVYEFSQLDDLELAYAVTVHKSQGSEYKVVVIPLFGGPPMLLTRNLLYTAVTRARQLCVLVGSAETMQRMVDNNRVTARHTALAERLRELGELRQ